MMVKKNIMKTFYLFEKSKIILKVVINFQCSRKQMTISAIVPETLVAEVH